MSWAVATTPPQCEDKALLDLEALNFKCYLPKFLKCFQIQGRRICKKAALFPGYVFFEIEERWKNVFQIMMREDRKVSGLITSDYKLVPIKDSVIEEIRSREGSDGLIKVDSVQSLRQRFFNGQSVRANHGPFLGFLGRFERSCGENSCKVLFDCMGRQVPVIMRTDELSVDLYGSRVGDGKRRYYRSRNRRTRAVC